MKNLEQVLTSIEVAEMMGKDHKNILADIRKYFDNFSRLKIEPSDFFSKSSYESERGKTYPCFNVTKKGCEFIAHKLTGVKGTEFTAKYINRFHEMEHEIENSLLAGISPELKAVITVDRRVTVVENKVYKVSEELTDFKNDLPLLGVECERITYAVKRRGVVALGGKESNAYNDRSLRGKVYADIHREIKRQFGVNTYKAIKRNQCDLVINIIDEYELPLVLQDQIRYCNAQMNMEVA